MCPHLWVQYTSRPPTPRNCLLSLYTIYNNTYPVISNLQIIRHVTAPKSLIFRYKSGIKIPFQTPTPLDFPTISQKSNFLPWQTNITFTLLCTSSFLFPYSYFSVSELKTDSSNLPSCTYCFYITSSAAAFLYCKYLSKLITRILFYIVLILYAIFVVSSRYSLIYKTRMQIKHAFLMLYFLLSAPALLVIA